jgi:hypothetical protein
MNAVTYATVTVRGCLGPSSGRRCHGRLGSVTLSAGNRGRCHRQVLVTAAG